MRTYGEATAMMTLLQIKALGLTQVEAVCLECHCRFEVPMAALHLPDDTLVGDIWVLRPIACPECSAPAVMVPPDLTACRKQGDDEPEQSQVNDEGTSS